jgi:uncharacterized cupin superfamily protein
MSNSDNKVPRFNVFTAEYDPLPEWGGGQKVLYQSPNGKRKAGSFKEYGKFTEVMPFDEFFYVVAGSTKIRIEGGESFELKVGDCVYFRKGMTVHFDHAKDFHDVAVLMSHDDDKAAS